MLADLKDEGEAEAFLTDFFNGEELEKFTKRISIAYWLKKGRDEENIKRNLLATTKEVKLGKEMLKKNGVKLALKKIEAEEWASVWTEKIRKIIK